MTGWEMWKGWESVRHREAGRRWVEWLAGEKVGLRISDRRLYLGEDEVGRRKGQ